jgi:tetratricopeptide (TPR) repeat protein
MVWLGKVAYSLAFAAVPYAAGFQTPERAGFREAESCAREARARIGSGDYKAAAAICERCMLAYLNSDRVEGVYFSLPAELLAGRLADRFERARNTRDVRELVALGRVLADLDPRRKTEGPELAEALLARAAELAPNDPSVSYNYGRVLRTLRKPDAMFAAWDKALSQNPDGQLKVLIYTRIAEHRAASDAKETAFRAALEINRKLPEPDPNPAFEYYLFLKQRSELDRAHTLLAEILQWEPAFVPAVLERGRLSADRQDWPGAIEAGEYVLQNADGNIDLLRSAHTLLARAYNALKHPEKAKVHQAWVQAH